MKRIVVIVLAVIAIAMAPNGPLAMDWHPGGHLCVLFKNGSVAVVDEITKRRLVTIPPTYAMEPVEIVSAKLKDRQYVFVSGFSGRSGVIYQYTAEGKPYAKFATPEEAASFDIDPGTSRSGRRLLYMASSVTNAVYAIDLDQ